MFIIRSGQITGGEANVVRTAAAERPRTAGSFDAGHGTAPAGGLAAGRNIVLVGFMGTGKTSTGSILGNFLGRPFYDVDAMVEQASGMTVTAMFERGEAFFREQESKMIARVARRANIVIATGGGAVKDPANIANLKRNGILVCLSASPSTIIQRLADDTTRPLLSLPDREAAVAKLLTERAALYRQADMQVDTDELSPRQTAEAIVAWLRRRELTRVK